MKTLCVTGHRPDKLPWGDDVNSPLYHQFISDLVLNLEYAIEKGYTHFISGGALGVDLEFAYCVLNLQKKYNNITLEIAVPCKDQSKSWSAEDKATYDFLLKHANQVTVLSENYYPFCMQRRNEYMVNKSDCVLCCFNGIKKGGTYHTIKYAQKHQKDFLFIDLSQTAPNGGNQMILFRKTVI